jgi:ABC-2 type transport system ATP-binding protein
MHSLEITNVTKTFETPKKDPFIAVNDVSFTIEQGKIHGLLGPNGAGKSTLISMICAMQRPDAGTILVDGASVTEHPTEVKQMLGVVPQEIVVEMAFTVEEVLYYFAGMYGVPEHERGARIREVLTELDLIDKLKDRARNLSGGMKRRLMIAKAILHKPKFLILDEPTAGVDVSLRQKIWALVRRLNAEGTTILFTTHYLEEAEQLCESITLIDHGRVIKNGKLKDIQQEFSKNAIHFELFDRCVQHLDGVIEVGSSYEFPMTNLSSDMAALTTHYEGNIKTIRSESASLEQIFLKLTNNSNV